MKTRLLGNVNIMPHSCCVPQCKSSGNQSGEKPLKPVSKFVTFHQLTKDMALRKKWIHAIRRDDGRHFTLTHHTTICSRHFAEECFVWTGLSKKRRKIKPECARTLFPWNDWGKRPPTVTARRPLQRPTLQSSFYNPDLLRPVALILYQQRKRRSCYMPCYYC